MLGTLCRACRHDKRCAGVLMIGIFQIWLHNLPDMWPMPHSDGEIFLAAGD